MPGCNSTGGGESVVNVAVMSVVEEANPADEGSAVRKLDGAIDYQEN